MNSLSVKFNKFFEAFRNLAVIFELILLYMLSCQALEGQLIRAEKDDISDGAHRFLQWGLTILVDHVNMSTSLKL